jgi:hypothetical protein
MGMVRSAADQNGWLEWERAAKGRSRSLRDAGDHKIGCWPEESRYDERLRWDNLIQILSRFWITSTTSGGNQIFIYELGYLFRPIIAEQGMKVPMGVSGTTEMLLGTR